MELAALPSLLLGGRAAADATAAAVAATLRATTTVDTSMSDLPKLLR
jgi:hypothetical protein